MVLSLCAVNILKISMGARSSERAAGVFLDDNAGVFIPLKGIFEGFREGAGVEAELAAGFEGADVAVATDENLEGFVGVEEGCVGDFTDGFNEGNAHSCEPLG